MAVTIIGNTIPAVPIIDLNIEVVFREQVVLTDDQFNQSADLAQLIEKTLILLAEGEIPPSQGVSEADIICPTGPSNCNIRSGAIVLDHFSTDVRNLLDSLSVTRFIWVQDPNFVDNPDNSISWDAGKIAFNTLVHDLAASSLGPFTDDRYIIATLDTLGPPTATLSSQPTTFPIGNLASNQVIVASYDFSANQIFTWKGLSPEAEDVRYDNATSGLVATDVQAALDELDGIVDGLSSSSHTQNTDTGTNQTTFTIQDLVPSAPSTFDVGKLATPFLGGFFDTLSADILDSLTGPITFAAAVQPNADGTLSMGNSVRNWGNVFSNSFTGRTIAPKSGFLDILFVADPAPSIAAGQDLGTSSLYWDDLFAVTANIETIKPRTGTDVSVDANLIPTAGKSSGTLADPWNLLAGTNVQVDSLKVNAASNITLFNDILPTADNSQDLGNASFRMAQIFSAKFLGEYFDPADATSIRFSGGEWQFANDGATYLPLQSFSQLDDLTSQVDGILKIFTLSNSSLGTLDTMVFVDGLLQRPTTDFTVSGTTLTMTFAPASTAELIASYRRI